MMGEQLDQCLRTAFAAGEDHDDVHFAVPGVPDDPTHGVDDGYFLLTAKDTKSIIDLTFDKLIAPVQNQIAMVEGQDLLVSVCYITPFLDTHFSFLTQP